MRRTEDVISADEAAEMLGAEPDEDLGDVIQTHDGEWRREGTSYRFFIDPDVEDER